MSPVPHETMNDLPENVRGQVPCTSCSTRSTKR